MPHGAGHFRRHGATRLTRQPPKTRANPASAPSASVFRIAELSRSFCIFYVLKL
ncbi:hypothetical protein LMG6000_06465 [Achromobacter insolitus]|uniref:Uncharacterized protein n=1 Tax=Achromobacter insolitus TaxID=217204 RepID=A0A6S7FJX8_9BURK|nr:hypothetical protein LMG6000_06465 [Achromobacter insolitus]CAB3948494.1 hypothetical protein LMG5997_06429 [Achromobacter insolitus]